MTDPNHLAVELAYKVQKRGKAGGGAGVLVDQQAPCHTSGRSALAPGVLVGHIGAMHTQPEAWLDSGHRTMRTGPSESSHHDGTLQWWNPPIF